MKKFLISSLVSLSFHTIAAPIDNLWLKAQNQRLSNGEYKQLFDTLKASKISDAPLELNKGVNLINHDVTFTQCLFPGEVHAERITYRGYDVEIFEKRSQLIKFFDLSRKSTAVMAGFADDVIFDHKMASALPNESHVRIFMWLCLSTSCLAIRAAIQTVIFQILNLKIQQLLRSGTEQSLKNFRDLCGDAFVSEVISGQGLQAVIRISSESESKSVMGKAAKAIKDAFETGDSGSQKRVLTQYLTQFSLNFSLKKAGVNLVEQQMTANEFVDKVHRFDSDNAQNRTIIGYKTTSYDTSNVIYGSPAQKKLLGMALFRTEYSG